jgi:hypothetical protein
MDDFDRFWQWANTPLDSGLTIPADIHHAVTSLPSEARRDRAKVSELVRMVQEIAGGNTAPHRPKVGQPSRVRLDILAEMQPLNRDVLRYVAGGRNIGSEHPRAPTIVLFA